MVARRGWGRLALLAGEMAVAALNTRGRHVLLRQALEPLPAALKRTTASLLQEAGALCSKPAPGYVAVAQSNEDLAWSSRLVALVPRCLESSIGKSILGRRHVLGLQVGEVMSLNAHLAFLQESTGWQERARLVEEDLEVAMARLHAICAEARGCFGRLPSTRSWLGTSM